MFSLVSLKNNRKTHTKLRVMWNFQLSYDQDTCQVEISLKFLFSDFASSLFIQKNDVNIFPSKYSREFSCLSDKYLLETELLFFISIAKLSNPSNLSILNWILSFIFHYFELMWMWIVENEKSLKYCRSLVDNQFYRISNFPQNTKLKWIFDIAANDERNRGTTWNKFNIFLVSIFNFSLLKTLVNISKEFFHFI